MSRAAGRYEIRIEEALSPDWSAWFDDLEIVPGDESGAGGTLLRGSFPDQAALFGALGRVRNLNLTLVSVERISWKTRP